MELLLVSIIPDNEGKYRLLFTLFAGSRKKNEICPRILMKRLNTDEQIIIVPINKNAFLA